jgi:hypothetical protein
MLHYASSRAGDDDALTFQKRQLVHPTISEWWVATGVPPKHYTTVTIEPSGEPLGVHTYPD